MNDLISRKAAIRWVKTECNPYGKPTLEFESGKKVIEHLEQMPSAQADSKELSFTRNALDTISRQAAIDALAEQIMESALMDNPTTASTDIDSYRPIAELSLRDVPSVQTEKMQLSKEDATKGTTFDCISREDAIDALAYFDEKDPLGHTPQQIIMALPSAQPENTETHECDYQRAETHDSRREWYMKGYRAAQPGWIPCEERLPEEQDEYLVTWVTKRYSGKRIVGIGIFEYDLSEDNWLFDDYMNAYVDVTVTAWMPLPPSYKEEQE